MFTKKKKKKRKKWAKNNRRRQRDINTSPVRENNNHEMAAKNALPLADQNTNNIEEDFLGFHRTEVSKIKTNFTIT